jgi:hypothetical protein
MNFSIGLSSMINKICTQLDPLLTLVIKLCMFWPATHKPAAVIEFWPGLYNVYLVSAIQEQPGTNL